jgi:DNA-directed RNA polymerase specialized sigma subunit
MLSARKLIETVNTGDTLTQEELFSLFSRASFLVNDCVRLLLHENCYIQLRTVGLGAEVAANLDRNKAIYRRNVAFVDGSLQDVPADNEKREADFLCACMDLQLALLKDDRDRQLGIVLGLPLTRMIFERFVKEWLVDTRGYTSACFKSVVASLRGDAVASASIDTECHEIERVCFLDPRTALGVIRYTENRLSALKDIYDRIFNAYSRVILKLAKSQAVSEDHSLDCFQNGSFGLLRAVSSYDHVSNARFVGHARWWIRQSMLLYMKEDSNIIRVSSNTWQHYAKLEDIRRKHESQHGPIDNESLSGVSGYSKAHVDAIYGMVRASQVRSLDYPIKPDGSSTLVNFVDISTDEKKGPSDYTASDSVNVLLGNLPDQLRNLVCLNFGLTEYVIQDLDPEQVEAERKKQQP